jgi:alkylation response protein AidB-like acyl-CoA dehydrogenase
MTKKDLAIVKNLFCGLTPQEVFNEFPIFSSQESDNLKMLLESVASFMSDKGEQYREYDKHGAQPDEYLTQLKELGLFSLIIPEEHGGLGLSNAAYSRMLQETSRYDASTSLTIGAHSSIGMKGLLLFGNPEQKHRYLSRLASGEMIAAFCLTEAQAGSDAASLKTFAKKRPEGGWLLNGEKIWITNGPTADFFTVFARTDSQAGKISAFIVERSFKGVSSGSKEDKMGIRASATSTVSFSDVVVPDENLLGEEGEGFKIAMSILNNGRTGLGGGCVGAMKQMINHALEYADNRKQFGRSISHFGLVREKLVNMSARCFAAESTVQMVAYLIDSGMQDYSVEAAISKIFASESLWSVSNQALQIAGGNGFMREYPYERVVRDSRINLIFEGTNEILRLYVGLVGLKQAGEGLKEVKKGVDNIFNDPIKGFGVLKKYAAKKIASYSPFTKDSLSFLPPVLSELKDSVVENISRLAHASEALLRKYGKKIVDEQLQTARVAEVAISLFVTLSCLSRASSLIRKNGAGKEEDTILLTKIVVNQLRKEMHSQLRSVVNNLDSEISDMADKLIAKKSFRWDVL